MTKQQIARYQETEELRKIIAELKGMKFRLDCGHHTTFGHNLSNDVTIRNYSNRIVCSQCGYEGM